MPKLSKKGMKLKENEENNKGYLEIFAKWLENKGLTEKTIDKHISNIDFYLNYFLTYYEVIPMQDGWLEVHDFLDDWFIRKSAWASESSLKGMAASLKKFYECMSEKRYVKVSNYREMCFQIEHNMKFYLRSLENYDNGSSFY